MLCNVGLNQKFFLTGRNIELCDVFVVKVVTIIQIPTPIRNLISGDLPITKNKFLVLL